MYYERYIRGIRELKPPANLTDMLADETMRNLVMWLLMDAGGSGNGLNLLCYQLISELSRFKRSEITDDQGTLSYYKILVHPACMKLANSIDAGLQVTLPEGRDSIMRAVGHSIRYAFHMLSYQEAGFRRYQVSEGLAMELKETTFSELKCRDVRLPFPSIYIEVPKCLGFEIHNQLTGLHPMEGIFLSEDRVIMRQSEGEKIRSGRSRLEDVKLETGRAFHSMMIGTSKNPQDSMDDATCVTSMDMEDETELEKEVAATARAADLDENFKRFPPIMAWVTNVLLYATWPDALLEQGWADPRAEKLWKSIQESKHKGQAKKLRAKFQEHHANSRITVLGSNILVDRSTPTYQERGEKTGRTLEVRIRVSGHMKRQPCGPGGKDRKIVWIRPYWKGPEDGPVKFSSHMLVAKSEENNGLLQPVVPGSDGAKETNQQLCPMDGQTPLDGR